jgi:hypothetical protein
MVERLVLNQAAPPPGFAANRRRSFERAYG